MCLQAPSLHALHTFCYSAGLQGFSISTHTQVNSGNWQGVEAAAPAVLMQLLQKWFQSLEQPVISATQQSVILAALAAHSDRTSCKPAVDGQPADCTSQATGSNQLAAVEPLAPQLPPGSTSLCSPGTVVAGADCLSVPQKMLIGKILNMFVAVTEKETSQSGKLALMQWLVVALTRPGQCGTDSLLDLQQLALLRFLELCASCNTNLQTLIALSRQPASKILAVSAAQSTNPAAVAQSVEAAGVAQSMNATAVSQSTDAPVGSVLQPILLQQDAGGETLVHLSAADGLGAQAKSAMQVPSAAAKVGSNLVVSDHEVDHDDADGCMWLHTRLIKSGFGRLHTRAGRPSVV